MSKMKEEMRGRAWRAMLSQAFFSVESAVIIALALILFGLGYQPFDWWQSAYWLIFGAVAEAIYLGATVTDPQAAHRAVDAMLADQYDPDAIKSPRARDRLKRALEYRRLIGEAARKHPGALRVSLEATASEINEWIAQIHRLARRLDDFEENDIIARDRRMVPHDLTNLRRRLRTEESAEVRAELEEAIQTKEMQLANLRALENNIKRAEIQLEQTLSSLGTVYAQVQVIDARAVDSARTQRLQAEVHEQVASLSDLIAAIDEVQSYRASSSGR